jgi:uncharacterized metal-binding protein YceD (DUF177 family)
MSEDVPLLLRIVAISELTPTGRHVAVVAGAAERERLATAFELPSLAHLEGRFLVRETAAGAHVSGRVKADFERRCVVSLEPFSVSIDEEVELNFAERLDDPITDEEGLATYAIDLDHDAPDLIEDGYIDLGAITAEFLALALEPYPHKPGVVFEGAGESKNPQDHPFAKLQALKSQLEKP